ncbi:TPA: DsbA family protein [Enterobacter hormaechei]
MTTSRPPVALSACRKRAQLFLYATIALAMLLLMLLWVMPKDDATLLVSTTTPEARPETGPPWRLGPADARFTIVLYADLECPFCKAYYPILKAWIAGNPEANLQWHHLPLPMHEPAATELARFAECLGETGGHAAFFEAVGWLYQHTRGNGQGLPVGLHHPGTTPTVQVCLDSDRPQAIVRAQAEEGVHAGVNATPSLRLVDNQTGQSLLLQGPVEGDALLSAMDLLLEDTPVPAPPVSAK